LIIFYTEREKVIAKVEEILITWKEREGGKREKWWKNENESGE